MASKITVYNDLIQEGDNYKFTVPSGATFPTTNIKLNCEFRLISHVSLPDGRYYLSTYDPLDPLNNVWTADGGSGGTDTNAIHKTTAAEISAMTGKTTLVGADMTVIEDSESSPVNGKKKTTFTAIYNFIKGLTDLLYVAKVTGSSLVADTEISKLSGVEAGAVALSTVIADTDIASAISLKHASGSDNETSVTIAAIIDGVADKSSLANTDKITILDDTGNVLKTILYSEFKTLLNAIYVVQVSGYTLTKNDLTDLLKSAYDGAVSASHSHSNKTTLDSIQEALTTALKSNYDTAYSNTHTSHSDDETAVSISEKIQAWQNLNGDYASTTSFTFAGDDNIVNTRNYCLFKCNSVANAVTLTNATNKVNLAGHGRINADMCFLGGDLPPELISDRIYFLVNKGANDFELALTPGGAAINFTTDGSDVTVTFKKIGFINGLVNNSGTITATVVCDYALAVDDTDFCITQYNEKIRKYRYDIDTGYNGVYLDASNPQGKKYRVIDNMYCIGTVPTVSLAAAGAGAACSYNVYDGATALYSSAPDLTTNTTLTYQLPNVKLITAGNSYTMRIITSAGATNSASGFNLINYLVPINLFISE